MVKKSINNKLIMEIVQKYVEKICENYKIEAIILFGSYAKGTNNENSDIAIITDDFKNAETPFIQEVIDTVIKVA